jgi:hypothetical protein
MRIGTIGAALALVLLGGCSGEVASQQGQATPAGGWTRLLAAAPFAGSYHFPVHAAADGRFVALHPRGAWSTRDGVTWTAEPLPVDGANNAYLPLVQHDGATWLLGSVRGNYEAFAIDPLVRRTRDYKSWEIVGRSRTMPRLVFPAVASFRGYLWMIGGRDATRETDGIWRSSNGLDWERVVDHAPWGPGHGAQWVAFKDRLWLIGGGTLDGPIRSEVWSSADGIAWMREAEKLAEDQPYGYSAEVFDGRIWLLGANRSGSFGNEMLVSEDGRRWTPRHAPWSPRGLPAVWTDGKRLFLTGGKYSTPDPNTGEPRFVYSNDVWVMDAGD